MYVCRRAPFATTDRMTRRTRGTDPWTLTQQGHRLVAETDIAPTDQIVRHLLRTTTSPPGYLTAYKGRHTESVDSFLLSNFPEIFHLDVCTPLQSAHHSKDHHVNIDEQIPDGVTIANYSFNLVQKKKSARPVQSCGIKKDQHQRRANAISNREEDPKRFSHPILSVLLDDYFRPLLLVRLFIRAMLSRVFTRSIAYGFTS